MFNFMKKTVVKEFLFEQEDELEPKKHKDVDLEDELVYFVDMEDSLGEDPDYAKTFYESLKEFGVDKKDVAIIGSYGADADWEDIKNELDRCQIEYYEFDDINGESNILFDINDLQSHKNEQDFKREWGGASSF
jgi:hypothetical protein